MTDPRLSEATAAELAEAFAARLRLEVAIAWDVRFRIETGHHLRSVVAVPAVAPTARVSFGRRQLDVRPGEPAAV